MFRFNAGRQTLLWHCWRTLFHPVIDVRCAGNGKIEFVHVPSRGIRSFSWFAEAYLSGYSGAVCGTAQVPAAGPICSMEGLMDARKEGARSSPLPRTSNQQNPGHAALERT